MGLRHLPDDEIPKAPAEVPTPQDRDGVTRNISPQITRRAMQLSKDEIELSRTLRDYDRLRRQQARRGGLLEFVKYFWHVLEPSSRKLVTGWPLEAVCIHLEAITFRDINRLLINVPPGFMKSLMVNCFWPAWEWGPMNLPFMRHLAFSYAERLTTRDNNKLTRLVMSPSYRALWGDRFSMLKLGEKRPENDRTGYVLATSITGIGTGERGDRIRLDDPHNVVEIPSYEVRKKTVMFFRESMSNRLNDEHSAIIVIMQRLHEDDVSGDILARESDYCHLMIPMRFDPLRYPSSVDGLRTEFDDGAAYTGNDLGWIDPRAVDDDGVVLPPQLLATREGVLAWPARFPREMDRKFETELGPIAYAGQYQQSPTPRKGNIFKREYWQEYVVPRDGPRKDKFPDMEMVIVSLDSAFTEKEENDPSGCTTWGIFRDEYDGYPKVMLLAAWRAHLPLHGEVQPPQQREESEEDYARRCFQHWGIVERVAWSCSRFGGADVLIVEGKASGIDVINEIRRIYTRKKWDIVQINPKTDKVARAISVQPTFAQHLVYRPNRDWADMVVDEMAKFPKWQFKDLTDSATQALRWMRQQGLIHRQDEIVQALEDAKNYSIIKRQTVQLPLYRA